MASAASPPPPPKPTVKKGLPNKVYSALINVADKRIPEKLRPLWEHPAGPKTIFFWAPLCKWGLVIAGLKDLTRPAETLSIQQSASLATTGVIWSRWSLIIIPKNWSLFSVNLFVALTQLIQVTRAVMHSMEQNNKTTSGKKQGK